METYHKIQTLFKRNMADKGKLLIGEWSTPELGYLANNKWEFTEKVDGMNIRIQMWAGFEEPEFGGRTDNAVIPTPLLSYLQDKFTAELFESAELHINPITLFGEGYGPKIQNGGNYRKDVSFVLFDVKIGDWWLHRKDVDDIAEKLGIDSVPIVGYGSLHQGINLVRYGTAYLPSEIRTFEQSAPQIFERLHPMKSTWGDFEAEGVVARPVVPMFDRKGNRIITKIKAVDFKP